MTQFIDPKNILFSLPTLCENAPAVDRSTRPEVCRSLHEDDWRQIEFVALNNRTHIEKELAVLSAFKQQHRSGPGWTNVYLRHEHPFPLVTARLGVASLPKLPSSALAFASGSVWGGLVQGGFAFTDPSNWCIYGQQTEKGQIVQLALSQSAAAMSKYMSQFVSQIAGDFRLLLVDWYACSLVETSTAELVSDWSMRYKPIQP